MVNFEQLLLNRRKKNKERPKVLTAEQKKLRTKQWTTFYRRNINIYATQRLRINLYPFQQVILYLMSTSTTFFAICTRGLTKTFIVALYAMIECMLRPYSKVVITASSISQGTTMVKEKMEDELCKKLSPVLKYLYEQGQIKFSYSQESIRVDFLFNGSFILVLPCLDSSRSKRATITIYEECRLLKKNLLDSIFEGMSQPRQARFLNREEYAGKETYQEDTKNIFITSARFKNEWFWRTFKETLTGFYNDKMNNNVVFAGDIFLAIKYGLKKKNYYYDKKKKMEETEFRMEIMNEMVGETADAFYSLESFKKNCKLVKAFKPPTTEEYISGKNLKNRQKDNDEKRAIWVDFAFANSTAKNENDHTVIGCMAWCPNEDGKIKRKLEYLETHSGGESDESLLRIRQLFFDYNADYLIYDTRNGGDIHAITLTKSFYDNERGREYRGFTACNDDRLQVMKGEKIDNLKAGTVDPLAIPCMIPVAGNPDFNSNMWMEIKKRLQDGDIELLIDDADFETRMSENSNYLTLTPEERRDVLLPYVQTNELINEAINLTPKWNDGKVKLIEPSSGFKDRIVAFGYGNYIATLYENTIARDSQKTDFDVNKWSCLAM